MDIEEFGSLKEYSEISEELNQDKKEDNTKFFFDGFPDIDDIEPEEEEINFDDLEDIVIQKR